MGEEALSTSPLSHPGLPATTCIYVVGLLPVELNVLFILVLRRQMVVTPNYIFFDCIILRRRKKEEENNYEVINTPVSFSVLLCFRSMGSCLLHIIAHERMHLLPINTKEGGTQNTCPGPRSLAVNCSLPSHSFQFCHSYHQ